MVENHTLRSSKGTAHLNESAIISSVRGWKIRLKNGQSPFQTAIYEIR